VAICYWPVYNDKGPLSVYNQQQRFFLSQNQDSCLRHLYMQQLWHSIQEWQDLGDTLIIGGDWNDDTAAAQWKCFWTDLGLYEPAKKGGGGPEATYNRGTLQVDNIYVSPLLWQLEFEVLPITEGVCGADHKALIFQIPWQALGIGQLPQKNTEAGNWKCKILQYNTGISMNTKANAINTRSLQELQPYGSR